LLCGLSLKRASGDLCSTGRSSLEHLTYQLHDGINHACQEAYDHQNRYQNIGEKVSVLVDLGAHSQSQASRVSVLDIFLWLGEPVATTEYESYFFGMI